ncbi:MAG: AAA family ATPase, partial [Candidatus Woesearchaeota archaeon]
MIWVRKYKPKNSSEIQGQFIALEQLKRHIQSYRRGSKPIIVHGPPGVGKTAAIHAIADELDLELLELNASDQRNKDHIET